MKFARCVFAAPLVFWTRGCVDLPYVEPNICGNGVIETGEQCDSYANAQLHQSCRPPRSVGECHFDCASTDDTGAPRENAPLCPPDMSCGVDGVCRQGQGLTFETWNDLSVLQAQGLEAGDFDGNGFSDLLLLGAPNLYWDTEPRALFFDRTGPNPLLWEPQTALRSLTAFPLLPPNHGERQRHQLVGATPFGLAVLASNGEAEFFAVPNPMHTMPDPWEYRMVRVRGIADAPLRERVLIYDAQGQLSGGDGPPLVGNMGHSVKDMIGPMTAGNVIDSAMSPCDEIIVTYRQDSNVYLQSVCDANGRLASTASGPQVVAQLPAGTYAVDGVKLAYVNDDPHLDLIANTFGPAPSIMVTFGTGNGTFVANPSLSALTEGWFWPILPPADAHQTTGKQAQCAMPTWLGTQPPLTVGDLNADGNSDWVLPHGVELGTGTIAFDDARQAVSIETCTGNVPFGKTWSVASIADFNGDRRPDLIAGVAPDPGLDLLLSTGLDRMNPVTIHSDGQVQQFVTGDYDGDLTTDIAFVQQLPPSDATAESHTHSLAIAFGEYGRTPDSPVIVARFSTLSVAQLLSANYQTDDGIEEIGLLTQVPDRAEQQLTLFVGNRGRHPIASLGLWSVVVGDTTRSVTAKPFSAAVGHFWDTDNPSLVALARDDCASNACPLRIWSVQSAAGNFLSPVFSQELDPTKFPPISSTESVPAYLVAGNLGATKKGESPRDGVLLLTGEPSHGRINLWQLSLPAAPSNDFAPIANPDLPWRILPGNLTPVSSPLLLDLDRDTRRDLALLVEDPATAEQHLYVLWNGKQGFTDTEFERVDVRDASVNALTSATLAGRDVLYVTTGDGVFRIEATRAHEFAASQLTLPQSTGGDPLPGGHALAIGDWTGDGVADLAVSNNRGLRLYRGLEWVPGAL